MGLAALPHAVRGRLIMDRPKNTQLLDGVNEAREIDRLDHVGVGAELVAFGQVHFLPLDPSITAIAVGARSTVAIQSRNIGPRIPPSVVSKWRWARKIAVVHLR